MPTSYRRTRGLFKPGSTKPYPLSRYRLETFIRCPKCFYLDRRLGIEPPPIPSFTLNSAVDELLKLEFDQYRQRQEPHPLMKKYRVDAVPFWHAQLNRWRENFQGVRYFHEQTNLEIFGAVDDLWISPQKDIFVVDYKSTSSLQPITLDGDYKDGYKRQMEIYQWLMRKLRFSVSSIGYFVYCNANRNRSGFEDRLEFDLQIIPYEGDDGWVDETIVRAAQCLNADGIPDASPDCLHCQYIEEVNSAVQEDQMGRETQVELF